MTDLEALFQYRLRQSDETLADARKMLEENLSPRSIVNRAYYATFYAVLALLLKTGVQVTTSKHTGVISLFDREFVHSSRIDKQQSRVLHRLFDLRQESDYREMVELTRDDAAAAVQEAEEFVQSVKDSLSHTNEV